MHPTKGKFAIFPVVFGSILVLAPLRGDGPDERDGRMVDLNVVAVDSHGQPVTDLTRDEFRVTDSGKPQSIAFFHHRDSGLAQAPPLGPNEFSNRGRANIPRATLILFDLLNERFDTRGTAANQLVHDLASLENPDFVYLYLLTVDGRLYPVHGLPGPEGGAEPPGSIPWIRQIKPLLNDALRAVLQTRPVDIDVAVRVQLTFQALDAVASGLSRVPGHKSIVWVTDGVPIELGPRRSDTGDWVDFTPLLRRMSEAFDRVGVAVYPVRQVMMGSPDNVDGANHDGMSSIATLELFAGMTGGRPDAGKDIGAAVRQALTDMRTSYQIGYYPASKNWDDRFHKLRITCTRKGVRIQTKTGYYAWQEPPGVKSQQAIDAAASTGFDAAEIGLRATLSRGPNGGSPMRIGAQIDAHDVVLVHDQNGYNGQLRLSIVGYTQAGPVQRGSLIPLDLHLDAQTRDRALQQGIHFVQDVKFGDDVKALRLIVFDKESDAIGSVTMPVPEAGKPNR